MKKNSKNKLIIALIIVVGVLLLCGLGFLAWKLFFSEDAITVPDFTNQQLGDVQTWCNENELGNACVITYDYNGTIKENFVVYQSIKPEEKLTDTISFIISKGKDTSVSIDVPEVDEDTTKETIALWVSENKLTNVSYVYQDSDEIEKNYIIKISPQHITDLNDKVTVYVSSGEKQEDDDDGYDDDIDYIVVEEGKYLGLTVSEFKKKVEALDLTVGDHVEEWDEYSDEYEEGTIVWHGSGEHYVVGEGVRYSLSLGKQTNYIVVEENKYLGLTLSEFEAKVVALGLKVGDHVEDKDAYSDTYEKGTIIWHGSGTKYVEGEGVRYAVSLGKAPTYTINSNDYVGKSVTEFENDLKSKGLKLGSKSTEYSESIAEGYIISVNGGTYKAGESVNYTVSLGKEPEVVEETVDLMAPDMYAGQVKDSFEATKAELQALPSFSALGSAVTYQNVAGDTLGEIVSISVNGSTSYTPGKYVVGKTTVVIQICGTLKS